MVIDRDGDKQKKILVGSACTVQQFHIIPSGQVFRICYLRKKSRAIKRRCGAVCARDALAKDVDVPIAHVRPRLSLKLCVWSLRARRQEILTPRVGLWLIPPFG